MDSTKTASHSEREKFQPENPSAFMAKNDSGFEQLAVVVPELKADFFYAARKEVQNAIKHLYSPEAIDAGLTEIPAEDLSALRITMAWTREFIMKPHAELGRSGSVCPYVKPSTRAALLYAAVCKITMDNLEEDICAHIRQYRDVIMHMPPRTGDMAKLKSIMMVFPQIPVENAEAIMEPIHKRLKTELLQDGMMLGQFYPGCKIPATWNQNFFPLQSPIPMFVIRSLIESDWRFLQGTPEWEASFEERFEPPKKTLP